MQAKMNRPNTYGAQSAQQTYPVPEQKNTPEKRIRAGVISATIWNNQTVKDGQMIEYKTVSFERSFKDKQGNWKTTHSLRAMDIPKAELVLRKAYEYLSLTSENPKKEAIAEEEIVY
jgi:hypothetical protein